MPVSRDLVTPRGHRLKEPRLVHVLTTVGGTDGHTHCAQIDPEGDGLTSAGRDGHQHMVIGLEVQPAPDGHLHELGAERCQQHHHGRGERGWCSR